MHARPASALEHVARRFAADLSLTNERTGRRANAKSVLGIVSLDIRHGDRVLDCRGRPGCGVGDRVAPRLRRAHAAACRRRDRRAADARRRGEAAARAEARRRHGRRRASRSCRASASAAPSRSAGSRSRTRSRCTGVADVDAEIAGIERALGRLLGRYDERLDARGEGRRGGRAQGAPLGRARPGVQPRHRAGRPRTRDCTAAGAVAEAEAEFSSMLAATGSALLLRAGARHPRRLPRPARRGVRRGAAAEEVALAADSVCVADTMTPGQLLALDRRFVKGLVLAHGGTTSHTVILARSSGIPTVVGVAGLGRRRDRRTGRRRRRATSAWWSPA